MVRRAGEMTYDEGDVGDHGPGETVLHTEQWACANLRSALELCAAGQLRCSATTGKPSAATVRVVAEHLVGGDFYTDVAITAFAWPLLLRAGGLAGLEGSTLRLTAKGRAALRQPPAEVIRLLWRRWLTHGVIDEFSRVEEIKGQRRANVLSAVKPRRQLVGAALAGREPGAWIEVDDLFVAMRRGSMSPTVVRNEMAVWKLYLVDPQYGSLGYDGFHAWSVVEGRYTLAVLFEYAATLGLIDVEYVDAVGARDDFVDQWGGDDLGALSRYDGLLAIRLNPLGAYAVGLAHSYEPEAAGPAATGGLRVLPNLDVVVTGELDPTEALVLSGFAARTSDLVWTVSSDSLLDAVGSGRALAELTTFLRERSGDELPPALETLVADVARRSGALTDLGQVRLVECARPDVAALISHDRVLRRLCRPVGDRHVVVQLDDDLKFRKALRKLGYVLPS